jgi:tetratricopeptide (TPR) repeat protein
VFRQIVKVMEEFCRGAPVYLTMLLAYVQRLVQAGELATVEIEIQKALELARRWHAEDPERFHDELTGSLETWAMVAAETGRFDESRQARDEAIELLRDIPGRERDLAQCLNNQSWILGSLGDAAGALRLSEESVRLYRTLVGTDASETCTLDFSRALQAWVYEPMPALGDALIALSSHQDEMGQHSECLASAQEACGIFFTLSQQFPDQFREQLGMARHYLGMAKFGVGDAVAGLREIQDAAEIYRGLTAVDPGAYMPTYAHILGNLVRAYVDNDRQAESISPAEECVRIYRELNNETPGRFLAELKSNLENLGVLYEALGDADRAKAKMDELAQL